MLLTTESPSSACDIWFDVPEDWLGRVTLHLYGRMRARRTRLASVRLELTRRTLRKDRVLGLAFRVRRRPCDGLYLTVRNDAGFNAEGGNFLIGAWDA
jgi:hypothetical protein